MQADLPGGFHVFSRAPCNELDSFLGLNLSRASRIEDVATNRNTINEYA